MNERQQLAIRFRRELAGKYGYAIDVSFISRSRRRPAQQARPSTGYHRKIFAHPLGDNCEIPVDVKRLSLGFAFWAHGLETVRRIWAD